MKADDLELWGGAECTVNRVGDNYRDQLRATGHHDRLSDFALMAGLGIRTIRFPILWERVAPDEDGVCDWTWSDERMAELDRLGISPIVGLLHHGSGPRHTSLIDDAFPQLFAAYAGAVAARYPRVRDWTPVNEPVTTARFSTLYRTWYPHAADLALFWRAMVIQTEATIAAMRVIRRINPAARLVQTDDLGETTCDDRTREQAAYYNARRWLGWDLLCGRVTPGHSLWDEGVACGLGERLRAIAAKPCPPSVIGIDHYVTSDRHLTVATGEPGFADEPALRALPALPAGLAGALRQAWERYRIPLAVTECHLGCTREEQLRWLRRAWDTAGALRAEGVDVRAVTVWAMFGAMDWDSLLAVPAHSYESGVFDVREGTPRPTAIARLAASLGGAAASPAIVDELSRQPGWWEHDVRFGTLPEEVEAIEGVRVILIVAGESALAAAFAVTCRLRWLAHVVVDRAAAEAAIRSHATWAVIDTGSDVAQRTALAAVCSQRGVRLLAVEPGPTSAVAVPFGLLVRAGGLVSPARDDKVLPGQPRGAVQGRGDARAAAITPDLVRVALDLLIDDETGVWQLDDAAGTVPTAFAHRAATPLDVDSAKIVAELVDPDTPRPRPGVTAIPTRPPTLPV